MLVIALSIYAMSFDIFLGGHIFKRGSLPKIGAAVFIFFMLLILILSAWGTQKRAFTIQIDTAKKTILFKHVYFLQQQLYSFSDFDSFFDTYQSSKSGTFKVIYLLKDKRAKKIITEFYYSNIDELQDALRPINYLGFQKDSRKISLKEFLNQPLLD